jgi:hypothetical protein
MRIRHAGIRATFLLFIFSVVLVSAQTGTRHEINIPDIDDYQLMKCDFHMHTVFSDGNVWPTIRPQEAWMEGFDAISITDHIEYHPHQDDIPEWYNRAFEIALPVAKSVNLMLVHGAEITRPEPPGHLNAIFLKDVKPLDTKEYIDAVKAAIEQDAFIFWNHPGWKQPGNVSVWYETQEDMYQKGWLHGIEVVNGGHYYANAHKWCLEKGLTMIGTSDVHHPITFNYDIGAGEHRPMTLVLVEERTANGLKQALFDRRTVVYNENTLIGEEKYLKPIFQKSLHIKTPKLVIKGKQSKHVQIYNHSEIDYELVADGDVGGVRFPKELTLKAGKTTLFTVRGTKDNYPTARIENLPYRVNNCKILPDTGMPVKLKIQIQLLSK